MVSIEHTGLKYSKESRKKMSLAKKGKKPPNYGKRNPIPEKKICKKCNIEKNIDMFCKKKEWYTNKCKKCLSEESLIRQGRSVGSGRWIRKSKFESI